MSRAAGCALLGFAAVLAVLALFAGCVKRADAEDDGAGPPLFVRADQKTGCEYLREAGQGGLTPRIAADGKTHMGCKGGAQ